MFSCYNCLRVLVTTLLRLLHVTRLSTSCLACLHVILSGIRNIIAMTRRVELSIIRRSVCGLRDSLMSSSQLCLRVAYESCGKNICYRRVSVWVCHEVMKGSLQLVPRLELWRSSFLKFFYVFSSKRRKPLRLSLFLLLGETFDEDGCIRSHVWCVWNIVSLFMIQVKLHLWICLLGICYFYSIYFRLFNLTNSSRTDKCLVTFSDFLRSRNSIKFPGYWLRWRYYL